MAANARARRRLAICVLATAYVGLLAAPYVSRMRRPTLYGDDVSRVVDLQTQPLGKLLFRPVNEHMAPAFEVVSWLTWHLAGKRLAAAPWAYSAMSLVPFGLCVILLGRVVWREAGSTTAGLIAAAVFTLATLDVEVAYWYSASTFAWALAATLVAWLGAIAAAEHGRRWGWFAMILGALFAPAFSGVGLLAAPFAAARVACARKAEETTRARLPRLLAACLPFVGTGCYLLLCAQFKYRDVLATNLSERADPIGGAICALQAPAAALLPRLVEIRDVDLLIPSWAASVLGLIMLVACLIWAWRSSRRGAIAVAILAIWANYALIYSVRTYLGPPHAIFQMERFHLYPLAGLVLLIALVAAPIVSRFDGSRLRVLGAATAVTALVFAIHLQAFRARLSWMKYDEQTRVLAAIDHLGDLGRTLGATRTQLLAQFDPLMSRWNMFDRNTLELLPELGKRSKISDADLRAALFASLRPEEVASLCGGMDATGRLVAAPAPDRSVPARGPAAAFLMTANLNEQTRYIAHGWPSFLEYEVGPEGAGARGIVLPGVNLGEVRELWWTDERGGWSSARSVRFTRPQALTKEDVALPFATIPQWPSEGLAGRRVRVMFHARGPVAAAAPRLWR